MIEKLFLFDNTVTLFFPCVPKLVIIIYGLENRRVSQLPLEPTFTDCVHLLVFGICADL
jgi:hypothetical protein